MEKLPGRRYCEDIRFEVKGSSFGSQYSGIPMRGIQRVENFLELRQWYAGRSLSLWLNPVSSLDAIGLRS